MDRQLFAVKLLRGNPSYQSGAGYSSVHVHYCIYYMCIYAYWSICILYIHIYTYIYMYIYVCIYWWLDQIINTYHHKLNTNTCLWIQHRCLYCSRTCSYNENNSLNCRHVASLSIFKRQSLRQAWNAVSWVWRCHTMHKCQLYWRIFMITPLDN